MRASRMLHLLIMKTPLAHTSLKKLQAIIFVTAAVTIFQVAAFPAELKMLPSSKVVTTSPVKLTCRVVGLNGTKLSAMLKFRGRLAMLNASWLEYHYRTNSGTVRTVKRILLFGSCLNFHNPDVTFCAAEKQLSVQFFVTTELAGYVKCFAVPDDINNMTTNEDVPHVTKYLQVTQGKSTVPAKPRAGLVILPESEILETTLVTVHCLDIYNDPHQYVEDNMQLKFGAGKYTAQLRGSRLTYPENGGSQRLPLGSCLDFSNPNVKFCHEKSKLLVQFNATQGLAGEVSCEVYMYRMFDENPGFLDGSDQDSHRDRFQTSGVRKLSVQLKKNLQITAVFPEIIPPEPRAGEEVTVTCTFAVPAGDQPERRMTGLEDWRQIRDRKYKVGRFTFLEKKVFIRNVTKMDNGRNVTCSSGGTEKSKTLYIGRRPTHPPIITMQPGDGETVFPGDPITCYANADPPTKEIYLIRIRRSSGEWDFTNASVTQTEFNIPIGTKVGDLKMICSARNALYSTTETFTYKVQLK